VEILQNIILCSSDKESHTGFVRPGVWDRTVVVIFL